MEVWTRGKLSLIQDEKQRDAALAEFDRDMAGDDPAAVEGSRLESYAPSMGFLD